MATVTADHILSLVDLMPLEQQLELWRQLSTRLLLSEAPDYIVYDVGYTERLCNDAMLKILWNAMFREDVETSVVYIWNAGAEEPYYRVCPDGPWGQGTLVEHNQARTIFAALKSVTGPGIVVENENGGDIFAFISALQECGHCDDLIQDTGLVQHTAVMMEGQIKTALMLKFDTKSG